MTNNGLHARVLPPEEWAEKLKGTTLDHMPLDPDHSGVIVVEVAGQVVACWAAMTTVHVEGLWEAESHRGHAGVGRALLTTMLDYLRLHHVPEVLTNAATPEVELMLTTIGAQRLPGSAWVLSLAEET